MVASRLLMLEAEENLFSSLGFFDFGMGIIVDVFQIVGIWPISAQIWKSLVKRKG